ncbi:arsenicals resistance [Malassezia caprae]|uniref:Arsenicals resistance n=1 Tax=Malassezia caprae TaxID=1381934 RepID=A0AAF0E7P1_9BASI|nr:arsenicals resistance [Malassezia caprae]
MSEGSGATLRRPHAPEEQEEPNSDGFILDPNGGVPKAVTALQQARESSHSGAAKGLLLSLGWLDRLLSFLILAAMILGVIIGQYEPHAKERLHEGDMVGVSAPMVVGLLVMMWPILTNVQYERIHLLFRTRRIWYQIGLALLINWIFGPFLMLGLAWATLPDLPEYRIGIIMVGLARCIAMVMIWNRIARGDSNTCAILVIINSLLQMVLYAPYALWFVNVISGDTSFSLQYARTATSVAIYLGIPLGAGIVTRFVMLALLGHDKFQTRFMPFFGPLSLVALLYTIIVIFASQSQQILDNLGPVFRTIVPLVVYFAIMWVATFALVWYLSRRYGRREWGYQMAVVQSFTASSNNFELAIAVCVALYGADSPQALAATVGPLVEVPVLLLLSWLALLLGQHMRWDVKPTLDEKEVPDTTPAVPFDSKTD